jgi:hypothetical protein
VSRGEAIPPAISCKTRAEVIFCSGRGSREIYHLWGDEHFPHSYAMVSLQVSLWCLVFIIINSQVVYRPVEVLNHCYKHGYQDLANVAAHNSLAQPLRSVIDGLTTPGLLARWVTLLLLLNVITLTKVMSSFDIITIGAMSFFMLTTYWQTRFVRTVIITRFRRRPSTLRIYIPPLSTFSSRPQSRRAPGVCAKFAPQSLCSLR